MREAVSLGWQVVDWIETILRHGPGDVQGEPIELDQELYNATVRAYQVDPETGRRLVRRYIFSRPKGRAKSEWAGMLVCAEALGPVRFDHWAKKGETSWWGYEYEEGEPVGRPPRFPFIRCLATEEGQAGNTYDNVYWMLLDAVEKGRISGVDPGLTRTLIHGGGEIVPSTASNASKDGGKETFAVFDETHLYILPELRGMHATVRRNLRKRKAAEPWSLETTTMFEAGAESVAETTFRALEQGKLGPDVVFDHREGPDPDTDFDWDSDEELKAALRVAYGPFADVMDLDGIVAEIRDPETLKSDAIRYFLNRRYATDLDFIKLSDWDELPRAEPLQVGDTVCVGFDGSLARDATGIVIVRGHDGATFKGGLWERPAGASAGWSVPRLEVRERVAEIMETYRVVRFYGDTKYWESDFDEWADRWGSPPVVEMPQSGRRLWEAASRMETLVRATLTRKEGEPPQISHDGDEDLRRHIGNARRERLGGRGADDGRYKLAKKGPTRRIDLAVAATLAHQARGDAMAAGELKAKRKEPLAVWI
ncbi:MAG TPA: hypothetical protein VKZ65_05005 [Glycomyces sp.]|nr:hypothetical protein [Glycomyces sp.]